MGEYHPNRFAFVDEGDDLHRAAAFLADQREHFVDTRKQHRSHKPCRLTDGRFLRFGLGFDSLQLASALIACAVVDINFDVLDIVKVVGPSCGTLNLSPYWIIATFITRGVQRPGEISQRYSVRIKKLH